jgi:hypothetical protein
MRMAALGLCVLVACEREIPPIARPTVPLRHAERPCDGFEIVQTSSIDGPWRSATSDGAERVFLASATRVEVRRLDALSGPAERVLFPPGEVRGLAWAPTGLWVAAGTGGVLRYDVDTWAEHRFARGADAWQVAVDGDLVWVADHFGRVRAIPMDGGPELSLDVDGWPTQVVDWTGGSVLVEGLDTRPIRVWREGDALSFQPVLELPEDGVFRAHHDEAWATDLTRVWRVAPTESPRETPLAFEVLALAVTLDGPVVSGAGGELQMWRNGSKGLTGWLSTHPSVAWEASALDITRDVGLVVGPNDVLVARRRESGWVHDVDLTRPDGVVTSMALSNGRLVVGTARSDGAGTVLVFRAGAPLALERRVTLAAVQDVLVDGDVVLIATAAGVTALAIGSDAPPRTVALADEFVVSLARVGRRYGALTRGRGLVWLDRPSLAEAGARAIDGATAPVGVVGANDVTAVAMGRSGELLLVRGEGGTIERVIAPGSFDLVDADAPGASRLVFGGRDVWAPSPTLGVSVVPMADPAETLQTVPLEPGAWDVGFVGDQPIVALGTGGVASLRRDAGGRWSQDARCELPGDTRRIAVDGRRVYASNGGDIVVLDLLDR